MLFKINNFFSSNVNVWNKIKMYFLVFIYFGKVQNTVGFYLLHMNIEDTCGTCRYFHMIILFIFALVIPTFSQPFSDISGFSLPPFFSLSLFTFLSLVILDLGKQDKSKNENISPMYTIMTVIHHRIY